MDRSLADYPPEILACITSCLHGFTVIRLLYATGSRTLWYKLQHGGVSHLELSRELSQKSDLEKMTRLEGLLSLHVSWSGISPVGSAALLEVLPVSLTRLHMIYGLGESGWIRRETEREAVDARNLHFNVRGAMAINLSERLPRLRDLSLRGPAWLHRWTPEDCWTPGMMLAFFAMLPRSLTSLYMFNMSQCELPYLSYLPPHLTKLTRSHVVEKSNAYVAPLPDTLLASLQDYAVQIPREGMIPPLPPHLTSLACSGQWDRLFAPNGPSLPKGLTSLSLLHATTWLNHVFNDESLAYMPQTLKRLHFESRSAKFSGNAQWPPNLTDLKATADDPFGHTKNIPKSLTSLWLARQRHLDTFDLPSLPQDLQSLHLNITIRSDDEIQQLPKKLTRLSILVECFGNPITSWPTSLVSLSVWFANQDTYWTAESACVLPNTLTHLETYSMPDDAVQRLPLSLVHLQLQQVVITGRMRMDYDPNLPSDSVKIVTNLIFNPLRFRSASPGPPSSDPSHPHRSLRQPLSRNRCMSLDAHLALHTICIDTVLRLTELPSYITTFEFINPVCLDEKALQSFLGLLVNLKSLVVSFSGVIPCDMRHLTKLERLAFVYSLPPDMEKHLPPNLTDLGLRHSNVAWLHPLPPKLRKLEFPSSLSLLEPLKQLESLQLAASLANFTNGEFLSFIDSLPCLTRLNARFEVQQTYLEGLVARGRIIELPDVISLKIDRPESISSIWGVKILESTSLVESIHQAVLIYYPHLPKLRPDGIRVTFRDGITFRNTFVSMLVPHLITLQLKSCNVPDRFTHWLPRTITDLDIIGAVGTSHRTTSGLPPSLTRLAICGIGFGLLCYQTLPRSITELRVSHQRKFWPKYAKALPPSLRVLRLDVRMTSNEMIAALPHSIISLDFGDSARTITGPALRNLPPNLSFLGGSFHSVDTDTLVETFSRIQKINSYERDSIPEYELRLAQLRNILESSSLDGMMSHLLSE